MAIARTHSLRPRLIVDPLDLIAEMSGDFAASRDVEETLRRGLERIAHCIGAEAASLFLLDEDSGALVCRASWGAVDITGLTLPPGRGIAGRTLADNAPRIVRDASHDPDFLQGIDQFTGFATRCILCAPMSVRGQRLGVIEVINKRGAEMFSPGDRRLLQALAASAALALINARLTEAMVEQEGLRRELALAAEIQRAMLPAAAGGGPIWGVNVPARAVSGDFYDIMPLPGGGCAFAIGDVAGKGINAALLMAKTSSLFRCLAKTEPHPGRLLAAINAELCETGAKGMFVTMVAGVLHSCGRVVLANAGHEPPLLYDKAGGAFESFPAQAPPLGIALDIADGPVPESAIDLAGRSLYLFTDGLTEGRIVETDAAGLAMLGPNGVRRLIADCADLPPAFRLAEMIEQLAVPGISLRDDLTLMLIEEPG